MYERLGPTSKPASWLFLNLETILYFLTQPFYWPKLHIISYNVASKIWLRSDKQELTYIRLSNLYVPQSVHAHESLA